MEEHEGLIINNSITCYTMLYNSIQKFLNFFVSFFVSFLFILKILCYTIRVGNKRKIKQKKFFKKIDFFLAISKICDILIEVEGSLN